MDTVEQLKTALKYAQQNPDAPQSVQLRQRIQSGMYKNELAQIQTVTPEAQPKQDSSIIASEKNFGNSIGDSIYSGHASNITEKAAQEHDQSLQKLTALRTQLKTQNKDTSHVDNLIEQMITEHPNVYGGDVSAIVPSINKTTKQVLGEGAGVLADVLTGGGALSPVVAGASLAASRAAQENKSGQEILGTGILGAITGKIAERGFKLTQPFIEKAIGTYGLPLFEKIADQIPKKSQSVLRDLATKATEKLSIGTGTGGSDVLDKVNKLAEIPFTNLQKETQTALDSAKNIVSNVIPQTVKENVVRVLKNTGKVGLKDAATNSAVENGTQALDIIRKNAKNIKITDMNGIEKPFDPSKATFTELPQALKQTKDAIYKQYTDIAKNAGDAGLTLNKQDFSALDAELKKYSGKGYTTAFSNKAAQLREALGRFKGSATPEELQGLIEQVNLDANPLSDKAGAQVANDFSRVLRSTLDNKLEQSGNPAYQATRDQYSKLKSIENDVLTRFKEAARKAGAKPDLIDHLTSMDALYGVLAGNPVHTVLGLTTKGIRKFMEGAVGPQAALRRAFTLLGKDATAK